MFYKFYIVFVYLTIHDTIQYTTHKNEKTIHDTIHDLTTMSPGSKAINMDAHVKYSFKS